MMDLNVSVIVSVDGRRVLTCLRAKPPYQGLINFVGGKVEPGETPEAAAYREVQEETGITPTDVRLTRVMDLTYYADGLNVQVFAGRLLHDVPLREERQHLQWLDLTENFFDHRRFAGEGDMGHILLIAKRCVPGLMVEAGEVERLSMHHEMSLRPGPFWAIAEGRKRYELRLNDEKRRLIRVGDTITFCCTADGERLDVRVTSLELFADFAALYATLPLEECGYRREEIATADPRDMEAYYSREKQARYGVLAIGISRE